ncbi:helix-turn-helix transcriptional regulator [Sarcina ventriculi]|uniref:helix-turn-helix transcriptional regulator n=1 Tax=Sarcina ventriculi TaxID=1267 RepID=UPI0018ABA0FE|nr:helix-turn-helix transcriptional regulator [Sarcina ventriculi]
MKLTPRQEEIVKLVKEGEPVTSETLATKLGVTRAALRPDLAILTMIGILDARPKVGYVYCEGNKINILYEEIMNSKVLDIMSKPITVNEETMVYDAIVHLFLNDVGTMFVENKGVLVGAVSRKDFLKIAIGGTDIYKVPVGIIMTRMPNIIYALEDETAYNVAKRIIEHEIDSVPVVRKLKDDLGKEKLLIVGKISKTNITRLFVNLGNY